MKTLISKVKHMAIKTKNNGNCVQFLDHSLQDPMCQKIIQSMNSIDINKLGITGRDASSDSYHFQKNLNRVTIEGNEDYRLVLFFIKKGTVMPLHDHPNMSVYFKLLFGKLNYTQYDKVEEKFRYNKFSNDEYDEMLQTKKRIHAKKSVDKVIEGENLLLVRPSLGNLHKFVAEEDSCFFDICLPNYTADSERKITYFNDVTETPGCDAHSKGEKCDTILEYYTTPPVMPVGFDIAELEYQGELQEAQKMF